MITGQTLRDAILSGANNIANQRTRVDELNVFPVPDGDTGTNMSMTIGAARAELEAMPDSCTVAEASKTAASAMLRGARGNSGVITSLLFRGFSKALKDKTEASSADLAAALQQGVEAAYKAVMKPTEGTILTVSRLAAEKAAECTELDVPAMWDATLQAGQSALDDTPNLLPVLKKAGVVDAGGQGIMLIFEGMKQVFDGGEIIAGAEVAAKPKVSSEAAGKGVFADDLMKVEDIKNGYCTQFLLHKDADASVTRLRAFLESNGDSVVVIEDDDVANCHVHTSDPGMMLSEAIKYGYLTNFKIENMHEQFLARQKQAKGLEKQAEAEEKKDSEFTYAAVDPEREYGFVAVAAGEGLKAVFGDLGVDAVVSGGQTMNPSTEDILAAIQSVPAKTVLVLPNNKNIIMASEQAQKLADRKVIVLPTRTVPQGMTAMLNFDPDLKPEENAVAMMQAADRVSTGLITYAARDSEFDGKPIKKGEIMALENGKIVATGTDLVKMTYRLARSMKKKDTQFITVISGCDVSDEDVRDIVRQQQESQKLTYAQITALAAVARERGVSIASHDDDSEDKLAFMDGLEATISEFPISLDIARAARARGMHTIAGAPNVMLGHSHSGNLSAREAVQAGAIDVLCSDYYPAALLDAVSRFATSAGSTSRRRSRWSPSTRRRAAGIADEVGSIAVGKRADVLLLNKETLQPETIIIGGVKQ